MFKYVDVQNFVYVKTLIKKSYYMVTIRELFSKDIIKFNPLRTRPFQLHTNDLQRGID